MITTSRKIIAVDFDGTLCEDNWPDIGAPNHEVINYIKSEKVKGAAIILWTCRCNGDKSGHDLDNAVEWCAQQGLGFDAINENVPEQIRAFGRSTRKVYADEYIDDKCKTGFKLPFTVWHEEHIKDDLKPTEQDIAIVESFIRYNNGSTLPFEVMHAFFKIDYQIYKKLEERI